MRTALLISFVGLLIASAHGGDDFNDADVARDSTALQQLLGEIRKALPPDWQAEITPDLPKDFVHPRLRDVPILGIWRKEKVMAEFVGPNGPGRAIGEDPPYEPVKIDVRLWFTTFLTPQQYQQIASRNANHEQQRIEAEKLLLGDIRYGWKGGEPRPPHAYKPQTPEEKERVRRYALLWMRTEITPLPTHYYRTLAFDLHQTDFDYYEAKDKSIGDEMENVRKAILNLVTEYPTKPEIEKGETN